MEKYISYNLKNKEIRFKKIISETQIQNRVRELATRISIDFQGESVYLVAILKGAFVLLSDLAKYITVPCECGFMGVSSYGNARVSSGNVRITKDLDEDIEGKNVIIVEDIIDTGITLSFLKEYMRTRKPKDVRICSLLSKTECRKADVVVEYIGFEIANEFVIGYGLDYEQYLRNLPYIASVKID